MSAVINYAKHNHQLYLTIAGVITINYLQEDQIIKKDSMNSNLFFILTALCGLVYTWCLIRAHFLTVKLDRFIHVPHSRDGEITIHDLMLVKHEVTGVHFKEARGAILNLWFSNIIAVAYLVVAILFIVL